MNFSKADNFGDVTIFCNLVVTRLLIGNGVKYYLEMVAFASDFKNSKLIFPFKSCVLVSCISGLVQSVCSWNLPMSARLSETLLDVFETTRK